MTFSPRQSYRSGDRVFAILQRPDVALLLTCETPVKWTAIVFDFDKKEAVAKHENQPSIGEGQKFLLDKVREHYQIAPADTQIRWQTAINRADILQT